MLANRDAFSQQAADTIDWSVRCDWLQVASSRIIIFIVHTQHYANEGCETCASVA